MYGDVATVMPRVYGKSHKPFNVPPIGPWSEGESLVIEHVRLGNCACHKYLNEDAYFPYHHRFAGGRLYCAVFPGPGVDHPGRRACVAYCMPRLRPEFTGLQVRN